MGSRAPAPRGGARLPAACLPPLRRQQAATCMACCVCNRRAPVWPRPPRPARPPATAAGPARTAPAAAPPPHAAASKRWAGRPIPRRAGDRPPRKQPQIPAAQRHRYAGTKHPAIFWWPNGSTQRLRKGIRRGLPEIAHLESSHRFSAKQRRCNAGTKHSAIFSQADRRQGIRRGLPRPPPSCRRCPPPTRAPAGRRR